MTRLPRPRTDTGARPPHRLRPLLLGALWALWALGCTAALVAVVLLAPR